MEYTIKPEIFFSEEYKIIEEKIIKLLSENRLNIVEAITLFNDILWRLTSCMPVSTETTSN